ncbi:methyl-accepting chemotaxis protein [Devosia sp. FKR38]|uniref:methyl-accepting chemotaxis protein n=1 Tax=Devosia sp. FKR38 TaxID=2562312 RepID=UPI0020C01FB6|nr:methyl-accepting chemotaxis protein [Devosia sp. FKR38]
MFKLTLIRKIIGLVVLAMIAGSAVITYMGAAQNAALLESELAEANVTVSTASTEQLAGGIRFGKSDTVLASYTALKESLGDRFLAGAGFSVQSQLIASTTEDAAEMAALTELAGKALTSNAVQVLQVGPIAYVAVPAKFGPEKATVGIATFAWDISAALARLNDALITSILVGVAVSVVLIIALYVFIRMSVTAPLLQLVHTASQIADNPLSVDKVPSTHRTDELGEMARAVAVFRDNGVRMGEMGLAETEQRNRTAAERVAMMTSLRQAFGDVVDAAVVGDFSKRVDTNFPDAEINALAGSVNNLVQTVDSGLAETGEVLSALADTNLTLRVQGDYKGAFGRLRDDTNAVADKLTDIVAQLRRTSRGVRSATGEILAGANDLSERTTKQAATIEETSATMEQLATKVQQSANKAGEASAKSKAVSLTAEEGGVAMDEATHAMERITTSSSKISNIIGLIDDIAFQTNLLALNASVEAARAGDAGKGFAVVAVEVRRLAQSAASASADVKLLIEQSATEVASGSKLVSDAASKLSQILLSIRENSEVMEAIAQDSREQAISIDEVNVAVRQMDEMTQHNAALVEQTNAAIEQTEGQASELDRIVDIFVLDDGAQGKRSTPPAAGAAPRSGIKGLQDRVKQAAKGFVSRGNTAVAQDWNEF